VRSWRWFKHYANYFPVKLVKTVDLPANKNYLFGCFPHAIIGCGLFANFATNATGFNELFPGIRSKMCTLSYHFYVPFFRELTLSWGMMSAKYASIKNALSQSTNPLAVANQDGFTSNAVVLVIGGAQEALLSHPGQYQIYIKNRKGFAKIALETGASLVPVFSFGEVEVFDQPSNEPGSKLRSFQESIKKWTGIAPAIFIGRGFFQYSFGLIPRRNEIHTVVGAPIVVEKNILPSKDDVEELHQKFIGELEKLFEEHKGKYIKDSENVRLIMV
jgi:2-acylglycerol O-acyltransferase 2